MSLFEHTEHPHVAARAQQGPVTIDRPRMPLNDRVARRATLIFGTMVCTYGFVIYGALGAIFSKEQATLLYWSNWIQLWSLPLLMVGQVVLGRTSERRNQQAFDDTEAILHGHQQLAAHQSAQDDVQSAQGELLKKIALKVGVEGLELLEEGHL